jgi:hypothetical protein
MLKKLFVFAVTSGLAAKGLKRWIDRAHAQREARARRERTLDVQRWEDEGGSVAPAARSASR